MYWSRRGHFSSPFLRRDFIGGSLVVRMSGITGQSVAAIAPPRS